MAATDKQYPLSKSIHILKDARKRYKTLAKRLDTVHLGQLEERIESLDAALIAKDAAQASYHAKNLQSFLGTFCKKTLLDHTLELFFALIVAITIAACVRQMWFEHYEIPSGSMRPTFREQDRVLVVKNAFGINTPFHTSHLLFEPNLLRHGSTIVFTGDGIDLPDVDTVYFGLFPGKKRYVKRCLGKPEEICYFYGGRVYTIDAAGNIKTQFENDSPLESLVHVPFITFDGKIETEQNRRTSTQTMTVRHMNVPVAKITYTPFSVSSELLYKAPDGSTPEHFSDILGIGNFAEARLIYPSQLPQEAEKLGYKAAKAPRLYMELKHHPYLPSNQRPAPKRQPHDLALIPGHLSWIPLYDEEITALEKGLMTARFVVKNNIAFRYGQDLSQPKSTLQRGNGAALKKSVPDGTYEFFNGIAYSIGFEGISTELPHDHPIYPKSDDDIKILFNSGIELSELTNPSHAKGAFLFPSRYAFFRNGDLYVTNHILLKNAHSLMTQFLATEEKRAAEETDYRPFKDRGAPIVNGKIDISIFNRYGVKIPAKHYLALGDNYPMSLDSRFFGFIPEDNIQGAAYLIFWPPGKRAGFVEQPEVPLFRIENLYIWCGAALVSYIGYLYLRRMTGKNRYLRLKRRVHSKRP